MNIKRKYRWILGGVAALLVLPVLALLAVMLGVDPNRFRGQIESAARERLGIPLSVQGDLRWRWWPLLSIEVGAGGVVNSFGGAPIVGWQRLALGAAWRPLLHQQLVVDRIEFDRLQLNLQRNAAGRGNWQALLDEMVRRAASSGSAQPAAPPRPLQINALQLRDARLVFDDAVSGAMWRADSLQLDTGIRYDGVSGDLRLDGIEFAANMAGGALPTNGVALRFKTGQVQYTAAARALQLPAWELQLGNAVLQGEQSDALQLRPLRGAGTLTLQSSSVRELAAMLGVSAPPTRDRAVLGKLNLDLNWTLSPARVDLQPLTIVADDTRLTGLAMWPLDGAMPALLELQGDEIDFDRYLRPEDDPGEPFELPVATLRALELSGSVAFGVMKMQGLTVRGARFRLYSEAGNVSASR